MLIVNSCVLIVEKITNLYQYYSDVCTGFILDSRNWALLKVVVDLGVLGDGGLECKSYM